MASPTITLFLPSLKGGGAERAFVQLANEFIGLGFRVDFALATACGPYLRELSTDVRIVDFGAAGVLRALPKLARYLRAEQPDVVLSGLDHANIIAILARSISRNGTRCIISIRSVPTAVYRETRTVRKWIILRCMKVLYRFADALIANSESVAVDLSRFLRIPKGRLNVVYNPINIAWIEEMAQAESPHPWCVVGASPIVLGVGSLAILKDFPTLIQAFSIVRRSIECRLVILGEGPDREKLECLVRALGLQSDVYFPGFVSNPFIWMRNAKVFVSSSLTEGCPNALMQALACGTPVVSTDCTGGSAEILEGGKWGRLVPVGDARPMAEAILASFDSNELPDVRQRAQHFALKKVARQYLNVLFPDTPSSMPEH